VLELHVSFRDDERHAGCRAGAGRVKFVEKLGRESRGRRRCSERGSAGPLSRVDGEYCTMARTPSLCLPDASLDIAFPPAARTDAAHSPDLDPARPRPSKPRLISPSTLMRLFTRNRRRTCPTATPRRGAPTDARARNACASPEEVLAWLPTLQPESRSFASRVVGEVSSPLQG
jgi:hypothetical protein